MFKRRYLIGKMKGVDNGLVHIQPRRTEATRTCAMDWGDDGVKHGVTARDPFFMKRILRTGEGLGVSDRIGNISLKSYA